MRNRSAYRNGPSMLMALAGSNANTALPEVAADEPAGDGSVVAPIEEKAKNGAVTDGPNALHTEGHSETWGRARAHQEVEDKKLMADYFVDHDFLVPVDQNPDDGRETVASILVNQGTTPSDIVTRALEWIFEHKEKGRPLFLTWYTNGHVVPTTLSQFRQIDDQVHQGKFSSALKLFLFPGDVDEETQCVLGEHAIQFVGQFKRNFHYAFLSAYSFDIDTGDVKFYFPKEVALQKVLATRWADHKFLFLQPSKFQTEGETAYHLRDMLKTSQSVTIYTVHSCKTEKILKGFKKLAEKMKLMEMNERSRSSETLDGKRLRLQIVGRDEAPSRSVEYCR
jgi:hypothetical protein